MSAYLHSNINMSMVGTKAQWLTTTGAGAAGDAYQVIIRAVKKY
jgi:hypothetical protein